MEFSPDGLLCGLPNSTSQKSGSCGWALKLKAFWLNYTKALLKYSNTRPRHLCLTAKNLCEIMLGKRTPDWAFVFSTQRYKFKLQIMFLKSA